MIDTDINAASPPANSAKVTHVKEIVHQLKLIEQEEDRKISEKLEARA